jgi:hypothetical protein
MHTEFTLDSLRTAVKRVGASIRWFSNKVCSTLEAFETPKEAEKRRRRAAREGSSTSKERQPKEFGLERYKLHAIGDYVEQICLFGTLDNYNTQPVRCQNGPAIVQFMKLIFNRHRVNKGIG